MAGGAFGRRAADVGGPGACGTMRGRPRLRLVIPGYEPEPQPALVRYQGLRQPGQGEPILLPKAGQGYKATTAQGINIAGRYTVSGQTVMERDTWSELHTLFAWSVTVQVSGRSKAGKVYLTTSP